MQGHEGPVQFYLVGGSMDLVERPRRTSLAAIRAQIGDVMPVAVAIDTLNRSLAGSESSDEDMGDYIKAADAIRDAFECSVTIIHHCGHDASATAGTHVSVWGGRLSYLGQAGCGQQYRYHGPVYEGRRDCRADGRPA